MHGVSGKPRDPFASAQPEEAANDQLIDIRGILWVIWRHKLMIAVTVVVALGLAIVALGQVRKQYTATALVVVDRRDSQMLGFPSELQSISADQGVDTEVEIAKSARVLRRAADDLDLANSPDFAQRPSLLDLARSLVGIGAPTSVGAGNREFNALPPEDQALIVDRLARSLNISRRGYTAVLSIAATAKSPEMAAKTANSVAQAYLDEQISERLDATNRAADFLRKQVDRLAKDISDGEAAIDAFVNSKLAELGSPEAKKMLTVLGEEAKKRSTQGAALNQLQEAFQSLDYVKLAQLTGNATADLATRRLALIDQLSGTTDAARLSQMRDQLDQLDQQIKSEAEQQVSTLQQQIAASNSRSADLRQQIDGMLSDLLLPKDVSEELFRLQRDVSTRRTSYDSTLDKLRQVEQQTSFNIPDSRIIASAVPLATPSWPPTRLVLVAVFALATCFGVILAFVRENLIGGIVTVEQFERISRLPVVAGVPRYQSRHSRDLPQQAITSKAFSPFSEAIRRVSLGIQSMLPKQRICIFITSALPGDGKTTVAMAIARHLATTGVSTVLIDADLRHPSVRSYLGEGDTDGLADLLSGAGGQAVEEVTVLTEPETNLSYILGSVHAPAAATDVLLFSERFASLLAYARSNYEAVIIDTSPVGIVVDATIVARHCDLGVFVVRCASTGQRAIQASLRELRRTGVPVCGVLNFVDDGSAAVDYAKYGSYYSAGA
jgi:polysaccharide biosynthesis transport protein